MKTLKYALLFIALLAVLTGCAGKQAEQPQPEEPKPAERFTVMAADNYEGYGFAHTQCKETGTYSFAPVNSDGVTWQVYILDEEFHDAERFIPQAYSLALEGAGTVEVKEGDWIYIYSSCNVWNMIEPPEGCAMVWGKEG